MSILEAKLTGKKGEGTVEQRISDLVESLNADSTFKRDFDDMTLKNSMPIQKSMNQSRGSKKSATNKFSSHTVGSRSPFEPMASAGTMLRDDLIDDGETSIALSMSMTNKQNQFTSPPHIAGNMDGTNLSKTGN